MIEGKGFNKEIIVEHVQQPSSVTCVHSCVSMITGIPVEDYVKRFGDHALSCHEEYTALIETKIFPIAVADSSPHPFPVHGVYLISTPSLNIAGSLHRVVVETSEGDYKVYDPNEGKEGKQVYKSEDVMSGKMACCDVTYLCLETLRKMKEIVND